MICPNCKHNNSDDSKFCKNCGATLSQPKVYYCKSCGRRLAPDARFCPSCGERKPLRTESTQTQRPAASNTQNQNTQRVHIVERPANYGNTPPPQQPKPKPEKEQSSGCGCLFHLIFFGVIAIAAAGYYYMQLAKKERMAYEKVKSSMNTRQMQEYLETDYYVFNDHKDDIRDRIDRIQTDNQDYRSATTIATCEQYLNRHTDGRYRKEVEKRLEALKKKSSNSEEVVEDFSSVTK
ncbi:MAG: zinc ribbon domain-containing protein, partial [Bacteroidaceae bacterium]|nr:zinc ribbon domain-containing protein [Bacteroidaceae bacterium]